MTSVIGRAVFIEPEPNSPTGAPTSCCAVSETRVTDSPVVCDVLTGLVPAAGPASQEHRDVFDGVDLGVARVAERHDQAVIEHACLRPP